jgi:outer membrane protein OmpA-like peptidoglycan-associated protein
MKANPEIKVELSGHTDNTGTDAINEKLSLARAQVVVDALIEKGISEERMTAKGYGSARPIGDNDTEEGRQLNRRTEFEVL